MLKLNHTSLHKMKVHAMRAYPEECCGVLFGQEAGELRRVCDVLEVGNQRTENRERRYLITPEEYRSAERRAHEESMEIIGFYHSHPDQPASPSQFDLEQALPWWLYLIISVESGQPAEVSSWTLRDDRSRFDEETVEVEDGQFVHRCKESS